MLARAGLRVARTRLVSARALATVSPPPASIYSPPHAPPPPPVSASSLSSAPPAPPARPAEEDLLALGITPEHFGPRPEDIPPISERLKPLIPFLVIWTIITSLAMHLLRVRKQGEAERERGAAQESVLRGLMARFGAGEVVPDLEIRRELEMVGLRERTAASAGAQIEEMRDVSWWEVLRGRREQRAKRDEREQEVEEGGDEAAAAEWSKIVAEATAAPADAPVVSEKAKERTEGTVRRAKGADAYL
ncbi:hypothetical protein CC85DRAFT_305475 [Cutaneotrichosporon oleaginosum]|uniref:Uncharacterized protein n=1 Tax=Cutaneotrichosporon oleaginosum TaxID=879819 RepID=A0A0J0XD29_9TREE|nr:uncharacterized protein CC85DRAFT_305475 [Cutaneotrichosporon oleaginosum]KLT38975.1 hypothetical protein CC85DRAFT_305475 [Cutaneotrichosporon oleaginosum]TXT14671.1 hypothetical protein COLE_00864 [Cutaneotrichosporon oleaginosum]